MSKRLLSLLLVFFPWIVFSQKIIRGKVIDETTGEGIAGCSVFVNNTPEGTICDKTGNFKLDNIPDGRHQLIFSSVGYETNTYSFDRTQLPLQLKVQLKIKVKEIEAVTVEPSIVEGWKKWGKTFTDNFIGTTSNSADCKIKNHTAIRFRFYKKSNRLIAYSDEPLLIENNSLGYYIKYQLERFEINFNEKKSTYFGYALFEDMEKIKKNKFIRRQETYEGSMMHFLRCLYKDSLAQSGFEVRSMITDNSADNKKGGARIGNTLLTYDSLIINKDSVYKLLFFDKCLYITYIKKEEEQGYILSRPYEKNNSQKSVICLSNDASIWIDSNGNYYDPKDLTVSGYWGWSEKIATCLPLNYSPW